MNAISPRIVCEAKLPVVANNLVVHTLWLLWQGIRLPTLLLLSVLEPIVSFVLGSLALLGVLTALFWKFVGPPHFPFLRVIGISLGFELVLILYHKILRSLTLSAVNRDG